MRRRRLSARHVEGGAVVRARADERQTQPDVYAPSEPGRLRRDQPLGQVPGFACMCANLELGAVATRSPLPAGEGQGEGQPGHMLRMFPRLGAKRWRKTADA
jgi:hypothetical protein